MNVIHRSDHARRAVQALTVACVALLVACSSNNDAATPDGGGVDSGGVDSGRIDSGGTDAGIPDTATLCEGATYYISPSGDDASGSGTEASPWRSLAHAASETTTAGSTIHVAAGNYAETEQVRLAPGVCVEGEGDASVITSSVNGDFEALLVAESNEGTDGHQHISHLKFDGNLSTWWGIYIAGRSNFSVHDCTIVDFFDRGVLFNGRDDSDGNAPPGIYATGNSFHHNVVHNSSQYTSYGTGCLNIGGQEGMLIYDNTITQLDRPHGSNGWPIKYMNEGWLRGVKIFNNVITKIPFGGEYNGDGGWDFAIELFNVSGLEIYNNQIQGSVDLNWQTESGYPYSVSIHDNDIGQPVMNTHPECGIILEFGTETALIENNHIHDVATGISFNTRNNDVVSDIMIRRNLFTHLGRAGAGHGQSGGLLGFFPEGGTDFSIARFSVINNTMLADPDDNPFWGVQIENGASSVSDVTIRNNISGNFVGGWFVTDAPITNLVLTNNDAFNCGNDNAELFTGATPPGATIADNIVGDPLFVSSTDYHLQASSPAVNAGVDVGLPFMGTAPDLGYVESH